MDAEKIRKKLEKIALSNLYITSFIALAYPK
jgi:hypothetical protein